MGGYHGRSPASQPPASAISASNLQLLREARQQPPAGSATAPLRVTHSPHGSLHSPLSVSLGSPHPSPASTSPQAPSPLPPAPAPAPPMTAPPGRSSPSSEQFPMRSRANTMSPPRGGRGGRYGGRPRSCSFTLPQRPGSSASVMMRRPGFSIAEIMEPAASAETSGALDLSVRRRPAPFDDLQEDPQDSISECVSDAVERFLDDDSKLSGTAQDSGISEGNRGVVDSYTSEAAKPSDSGSAGSKLTAASVGSTGGISQPPKKRRLTLDQATVAAAGRQAVITGYFPTAPVATTAGAATLEKKEDVSNVPTSSSSGVGSGETGGGNTGAVVTTNSAAAPSAQSSSSVVTPAAGAEVSTTPTPATVTNSGTGDQAGTRPEVQQRAKREWCCKVGWGRGDGDQHVCYDFKHLFVKL